jgi:hypothetical protein
MIHPSPLSALRADHGVTLIEMLVAILTSIVVLGALLAILEFTVTQESSIADRVSSGRLARLTMAKAVQELQSSCTGFGATAIQAPAKTPTSPLKALNATNLWFLSAYGLADREAAVLTSVAQHDINWTETGKSKTGQKLGTLTDYAFKSEGGESPNWVFPALSVANAKATVLATNVIPPEECAGSIFKYEKFESAGSLSQVSGSEAEAAAANGQIAKVEIRFTQAAENADTKPGQTTSVNDSVLLRFNSATATESGTSPCA